MNSDQVARIFFQLGPRIEVPKPLQAAEYLNSLPSGMSSSPLSTPYQVRTFRDSIRGYCHTSQSTFFFESWCCKLDVLLNRHDTIWKELTAWHDVLASLLLVWLGMLLAIFAARVQSGLAFSILHALMSFKEECFPGQPVPNLSCSQGLFLSTCRASHLSFLNRIRLLLAHSSLQPNTPWTAVLPLSVLTALLSLVSFAGLKCMHIFFSFRLLVKCYTRYLNYSTWNWLMGGYIQLNSSLQVWLFMQLVICLSGLITSQPECIGML